MAARRGARQQVGRNRSPAPAIDAASFYGLLEGPEGGLHLRGPCTERGPLETLAKFHTDREGCTATLFRVDWKRKEVQLLTI